MKLKWDIYFCHIISSFSFHFACDYIANANLNYNLINNLINKNFYILTFVFISVLFLIKSLSKNFPQIFYKYMYI